MDIQTHVTHDFRVTQIYNNINVRTSSPELLLHFSALYILFDKNRQKFILNHYRK